MDDGYIFTGSPPELVLNTSIDKLEGGLIVTSKSIPIGNEINVGSFWKDYISPNIYAIFGFFLVGLFLYYKYVTKKEKTTDHVEKFVRDLAPYTRHSNKATRVTMNPSIPINKQKPGVNFLPDDIIFDVDRNHTMKTHNEVYPKESPQLSDYDYMGDKQYDRDVFTGTFNTYGAAMDHVNPNPLGFSNNENSTTDQYGEWASAKNKKNLQDWNQFIHDDQNDLMHHATNWDPYGIGY